MHNRPANGKRKDARRRVPGTISIKSSSGAGICEFSRCNFKSGSSLRISGVNRLVSAGSVCRSQ